MVNESGASDGSGTNKLLLCKNDVTYIKLKSPGSNSGYWRNSVRAVEDLPKHEFQLFSRLPNVSARIFFVSWIWNFFYHRAFLCEY
jgi:hypothetical protein